jgi:hypothetical protein
MKNLSYSMTALLLFVAVSCKKDDPAVAGGCSFTFKGTSYSTSAAVCGTASGTQTVVGSGTNQLLSVYKGGVIGDEIAFALNIKSGDTYSTIDSGITPTITVSGKTWTFSGTAENDDGVQGQISGRCTCTN